MENADDFRPVRSRSRKPKRERRSKLVGVWMHLSEVGVLDARRGRVSRAEFMRRAALGQPVPAVPPAINRQAWGELSRVASNLNQIAYRCNSDQRTRVELRELQQLLKQVRAGLLSIGKPEVPPAPLMDAAEIDLGAL